MKLINYSNIISVLLSIQSTAVIIRYAIKSKQTQ